MIGKENAPASPRGFWAHTYFEMQGNYLVAKCYLVAIDTPVFFELKVDVSPLLSALKQGHSWLHAQSSVAGEGIPVNLIGVQTALVERAANAAEQIARVVSENQVPEFSPGHSAFAAANALLASIERKNLIRDAALVSKRRGMVNEHVEQAMPMLKQQALEGKVAGQVVGKILEASRSCTMIGASDYETTNQAVKTASVLRMAHEHRQHMRELGKHGLSTGKVVDENGNIKHRLSNPIPSVNQTVPQLANAINGASIIGAEHATIVGLDCIGCGCIGCY